MTVKVIEQEIFSRRTTLDFKNTATEGEGLRDTTDRLSSKQDRANIEPDQYLKFSDAYIDDYAKHQQNLAGPIFAESQQDIEIAQEPTTDIRRSNSLGD